jgi:C4-type Zn-finger protein
MLLKLTDRMQCPHCGAELQGTVAGYVVPDTPPGDLSQALGQCEYCDEEFTAKLLDHAGNVQVLMF